MRASQIAALVGVTALSGAIVLQLLLAAGQPLGQFAWRARYRVLPRSLRFASLAAAALLALAGWILLAAAGFLPGGASPLVALGTWVFAGFFALNTLGNLTSPSRAERALSPLTLILTACFLIVARAGG